MARYWKNPGPRGQYLFSLPHPDLQYRWAFDSEYSLPRTHLLRVAAPETIIIQCLCTTRDDPGPQFERVPEPQASELLKCVEAEEKKQGRVAQSSGLRKVFVHVVFGPQVVHHRPFKHADPTDPTHSTEVDAVIGSDITLAFHDDDAAGFEFAIALQGSGNWIVADPNRLNPAIPREEIDKARFAAQGQIQLQLAYAFRSVTILDTKLTFSVLLQAAGSAAYQYDVEDRKPKLGGSASFGGGGNADIKLTEDLTLGLQGTIGVNSQRTIDFTGGATLKWEFDLTGKPKKK